jgi:hypothetical protein
MGRGLSDCQKWLRELGRSERERSGRGGAAGQLLGGIHFNGDDIDDRKFRVDRRNLNRGVRGLEARGLVTEYSLEGARPFLVLTDAGRQWLAHGEYQL